MLRLLPIESRRWGTHERLGRANNSSELHAMKEATHFPCGKLRRRSHKDTYYEPSVPTSHQLFGSPVPVRTRPKILIDTEVRSVLPFYNKAPGQAPSCYPCASPVFAGSLSHCLILLYRKAQPSLDPKWSYSMLSPIPDLLGRSTPSRQEHDPVTMSGRKRSPKKHQTFPMRPMEQF